MWQHGQAAGAHLMLGLTFEKAHGTLRVCENQIDVKCVIQSEFTLLAFTNCPVRAVRRTFCH